MQLKLFLIAFLFLTSLNVSAQPQMATLPLQNLLSGNKPVANISYENLKYVNIADTPVRNFPQYLIKTSQGLFVFANGSGRVYQLLNNGIAIETRRIDSTVFFGYNLNSYPFTYNDTIYSLGGYGIWRINGQLRVYVAKSRQWDVVPLNEEIPVQVGRNAMVWYDMQHGKIYIGWSVSRNQAVKSASLNETNFAYDACVLDLATKNWTKLGPLNDYLIQNSALIVNMTSSPWGQLISFGDKLVVINYELNRLLYLKPGRNDAISSALFSDPDSHLYYFKDSTLYFGSTGKNLLDSIRLHTSDFLISDKTVYTPIENAAGITENRSANWLYFSGGFIVFSGIGLLVWTKKKSSIKKAFNDNDEATSLNEIEVKIDQPQTINSLSNGKADKINSSVSSMINFDEKELQLLAALYTNALQGRATTIEELNKALGVTQKKIDIQKKQRSDAIRSINHKYNLLSNKNDEVIERKKNDLDKRSFEYFINEVKLSEVKKYIPEPA